MTGPVPITATHRLEFEYRAGGLTHKSRILCDLVASGDVTGYNLSPRSGASAVGASAGIDRVWTLMAPLYDAANDSFGQVVGAAYVSGAYVPIFNYSTAVVPTGTGTTYGGTQLTNFFYGVARSRNHFDIFGVQLAPADRWDNLSLAPTDVATLVSDFITNAATAAPYNWAVTRGDRNLVSWVGSTLTVNRKSRRRLGIL